MQMRKVPMRMCTGWGQMKPKRELGRVGKSPDGDIALGLTVKKDGRGGYVCRDIECLQKARKARRLEKAFSCRIPDEVYDRMEEELQSGE